MATSQVKKQFMRMSTLGVPVSGKRSSFLTGSVAKSSNFNLRRG